VKVGEVALPNPVMTAAGTAGHADELGRYLDLGRLGAVVVKSLSAEPWAGNPAPRVHETPAGMLNSVGLQNPGLPAWRDGELPGLLDTGARVVVSIWGRSVEEYATVAALVGELPAGVVTVEVNLSCPNLSGKSIFAHDAEASAGVVSAVAQVAGRPVWAKLSPNTDRLTDVAQAVAGAGADAVTLTNTMLGMAIDPVTRRPRLGGGGGGLSGPAMHPVAVRAVYDCRAALPTLPIIGVGGIASGSDAVEMMVAGAHAVQVGTASFADPRAAERVLDEIETWCAAQGVDTVSELTGGAHV
jgi:dihydroorotate dehydrogenase (NAD+) catalytic subunit